MAEKQVDRAPKVRPKDTGQTKKGGTPNPATPSNVVDPQDDALARVRGSLAKKGGNHALSIPIRFESEMPWIIETEIIRDIHENLPSSKLFEVFSSVQFLDAVPIIDPQTGSSGSIVVAMSAVHSNGSDRCLDSTQIPFFEDLVPRLRKIGLAPEQLCLMLVPRERFEELRSLAVRTTAAETARREKLDELDPAASARMIFPKILAKAVRMDASDVHIEPRASTYHVRMRIDGRLKLMFTVPVATGEQLVNVIKVDAQMKSDEHRLPQDKQITVNELSVDDDLKELLSGLSLRVSTVPTAMHEGAQKVVLRLLRPGAPDNYDLDRLGLPEDLVAELKEIVSAPRGLILVTGPTGSGKSTTFYATLRHLNTGDCSICTVEDPVEVRFPDMDQTQVREEIKLTFARALRSFLRQDPDIILIGEIRDDETAAIAVQASQTGHLVLATLHANDAFGVFPRLKAFGLGGADIENALRGVAAQRLVRTLCLECREQYDATDEFHSLLGEDGGILDGKLMLWRPRERSRANYCHACKDTGYSGRMPVIELWVPSQAERNEIVYNSDTTHERLAEMAMDRGMRRMGELGLNYVAAGITTLNEVVHAVSTVEEFRHGRLKKRAIELFTTLLEGEVEEEVEKKAANDE